MDCKYLIFYAIDASEVVTAPPSPAQPKFLVEKKLKQPI